MTDQSSTQEQFTEKREPATTPNTAQAENVQHTLYLNINRNWVPEDDNSFYGRKAFFLKDGSIGMEFCGRVFVASIELWASLALAQEQDE